MTKVLLINNFSLCKLNAMHSYNQSHFKKLLGKRFFQKQIYHLAIC